MSTNEKTSLKLDKNNEEAVVELSPNEADAVAGGVVGCPQSPSPDDPPMPGCTVPPRPA